MNLPKWLPKWASQTLRESSTVVICIPPETYRISASSNQWAASPTSLSFYLPRALCPIQQKICKLDNISIKTSPFLFSFPLWSILNCVLEFLWSRRAVSVLTRRVCGTASLGSRDREPDQRGCCGDERLLRSWSTRWHTRGGYHCLFGALFWLPETFA